MGGIFYWWVSFRFVVADSFFSPWRSALPGVARRLLTFLASPRKVSKRRRPQESLPAARVPKSSDSQPASQTNSLRSDMFAPLDPSDHRLPWQRQMRNVKSNSLVEETYMPHPKEAVLGVPLCRCRLCGAENGKRSGCCLSVASFAHFPFFVLHKRGPRRGSGAVVAFLCSLSLAKQRK